MVEIVSPPHVPGPPPHFHKNEREFFPVIDGTLDVMVDGARRRCGPGAYVELEPSTTHTFINNTESEVVWVTGWRPKGFERSVSDAVVQQVVRNIERYGMYLGR